MNQAVVTMTSCHVRDNKAPGFEATHEGTFILDRCHVHENVGGIWLWENGRCDVRGTVIIDCGELWAALVDNLIVRSLRDQVN